MHPKEKEARDRLKQIAREHGPLILMDGEVIAVDADNYFCDVQLDTDVNAVLYDCRLRAASIGNQSIDILPAIGSEVVIAKIAEDDYLVLAIDEITSYRLTVGDMVFKMDASGFEISNGVNTLKDILSAIIAQLLEIYAPKNIAGINAITPKINALLQ